MANSRKSQSSPSRIQSRNAGCVGHAPVISPQSSGFSGFSFALGCFLRNVLMLNRWSPS